MKKGFGLRIADCGLLSLMVLVCVSTLAVAQTRPAGASTASTPSYRERYGLLGEGNIFVRDRWKPTSRPSQRDSRPPAPPPEKHFLLTGTVREDDTFRAYVEDTSAGKILRLSPGDAVARGRVNSIDEDGITYELDGQLTWVEIGRDLSGGQFAGTIPAAPTTGPALDPNNPNLTMEERMKIRRMQELNNK